MTASGVGKDLAVGHFAFCLNLECGILETVSKLIMERAFSPLFFVAIISWGVASG
jgi:hypothetical protein